jgi:hypothetical protein
LKPKSNPTDDAEMKLVLNSLLNGDSLIQDKRGGWELEVAKVRLSSPIVRRLFRKGNRTLRFTGSLHDHYCLTRKGIQYALKIVDAPKLERASRLERDFDLIQRLAFRSHLALSLRIRSTFGLKLDNEAVLSTAEKVREYIRKTYLIKPPREPMGGIIDIPLPSRNKNPHANQFRRSEFLRPRIKAQHRH